MEIINCYGQYSERNKYHNFLSYVKVIPFLLKRMIFFFFKFEQLSLPKIKIGVTNQWSPKFNLLRIWLKIN